MPAPSHFSWLLHGNDEGAHTDGSHALSVNWVMPAGPDKDVAVDDQFWTELGELIWPWELDIFGWHGIESAQSLAIKRLSVGWKSALPKDVLDIQVRVKEQIKTRTHGCTKPFTVQVPRPDAAPGSPLPVCLPNEFAPLTHLPAGISANVLGMTRALRVSKEERDKFRYLVPEFRATIGGALWTFSPEVASLSRPDSTIIEVKYKATTGAVDVLPFTFSIRTNPLETLSVAPQTKLGGGGLLGLDARISALAPSICPLVLLVQKWNELVPLWQSAHDVDPTQPDYLALTLEGCLQRLLGNGVLTTGSRTIGGVQQPVVTSIWELLDPGLAPDKKESPLHHPVSDGLARMVRYLNSSLSVGLDAGSGDAQRKLEILQSMRRALQPVLDAAASNEGAYANWNPGTIGTQRSKMVLQAMAQCMADTETTRFLLAAWLAMRAVAAGVSGAPFGQHWLRILQLMSAQIAVQLIMYPILKVADGPDTLLTSKDVAGIGTRGIAPPEWRCLKRRYATEVLLAFNGVARAPAPAVKMIAVLNRALQRLRPATEATLPEDGDLAIEVEVAVNVEPGSSTPDTINQQLRGYAIALAAGYPKDDGSLQIEAKLGCDWITDVACKVKDTSGSWNVFVDATKTPIRFHETVGATREGGRQVISFNYGGKALCARLEEAPTGKSTIEGDPDGVLALDFYWPDDLPNGPRGQSVLGQLPQLAYGLEYVVVAAAIGNAGKVLTEGLADKADDRKLISFKQDRSPFKGQSFLYQSRVAPGVPLVSLENKDDPGQCYRYANETRARVFQRLQGTDAPIALIRPKNDPDKGYRIWKGGAPEAGFIIRGPDATPKLIERWLQADWAARVANKPDRCDAGTASADDILGYQRMLLEQMASESGAASRPRHPMVRGFGIVVELHDARGVLQDSRRCQLEPAHEAKDGYIGKAYLTVQHNGTHDIERTDDTHLRIDLPAGWFARVQFLSLVPAEFLKPPMRRLAPVGTPQIWTDPEAPAREYRYYNHYEHWFECASELAPNTVGDIFDQLNRMTRLRRDDSDICTVVAAPGNGAAASGLGIPVEHLSGLYVERHEWHWTGYPLAFAHDAMKAGRLEDWAGPFIGTESIRDSLFHRFTDQVNSKGELCFALNGEEVLSRYRIPAEHGAKYAASMMRPVWRYEAWRRIDKPYGDKVLAAGGLIAARVRWEDPTLRLPPPRVKVALPLTRTFRPDASHWLASANGSVLILDDVLYRTDPGERFGGVSETLQVELESTRVSQVYEVGANPIFHAGTVRNPSGQETALPYPATYGLNTGKEAGKAANPWRALDWGIEVDAPFGLTHDLDRNPKVAQTAVIVRPTGTDVHQYWVMAKIRLRRMLDPEELWTLPETRAAQESPGNKHAWTLRRRREGKEWVPHDWCLDLPAGSNIIALSIAGVTVGGPLAAQADSSARRLIGSWHKGKWTGNSANYWGVQIMLQYLSEGTWKTLRTYSPWETGVSLALDKCTFDDPVPVELERGGAAQTTPAFRRVLLSDYSEPHWLTFIGLPYRSLAFANEKYWLEPSAGALTLMRTSSVKKDGERREDISRDLILNPVQANHFNGSAEERAQAEENSFHLLLLFERINDVATPQDSMSLGSLKAVCYPTRARITADNRYPPILFRNFMDTTLNVSVSNVQNLVGYLYRFHRAVDNDGNYPAIDNWARLVELMFPADADRDSEARVRWTPEYIGPIAVTDKEGWAGHQPGPEVAMTKRIRITLGGVEKARVLVNPDWGWRLENSSAASRTLFSERDSGPCRVAEADGQPVLELLASGNCLLARLKIWTATKGAAAGETSLFDAEGKIKSNAQWRKEAEQ